MVVIISIILYLFVVAITYIIMAEIVNSNIGKGDNDYDKVMLDGSAKMLALLTFSLIWFISIPILIINNLKRRND